MPRFLSGLAFKFFFITLLSSKKYFLISRFKNACFISHERWLYFTNWLQLDSATWTAISIVTQCNQRTELKPITWHCAELLQSSRIGILKEHFKQSCMVWAMLFWNCLPGLQIALQDFNGTGGLCFCRSLPTFMLQRPACNYSHTNNYRPRPEFTG